MTTASTLRGWIGAIPSHVTSLAPFRPGVDGFAAFHAKAVEFRHGLFVGRPARLRASADGAIAASVEKQKPATDTANCAALVADFGASSGRLESGFALRACALRNEGRNTAVNDQFGMRLPEIRVGFAVAFTAQRYEIFEDVGFNVGIEKLERSDVVNLQRTDGTARLALMSVAFLRKAALFLPVPAAIPSVTSAPCRIRRAAEVVLSPLPEARTRAKRTQRLRAGWRTIKGLLAKRAIQFHPSIIASTGI